MSVFTTGAHITPYLRPDGKWVWVVTCFEDDTYDDGYTIEPDVVSDTRDGLWKRPPFDLELEEN